MCVCVYSRLREKRDDDISGEIIFSKYLFDILSNLFSLPLSVALRDSPLPRVVAGRRTVLRCRRRQAVWPVYSSVAKASPPLRLSFSLFLASAPTPPTLSFSIVYSPRLALTAGSRLRPSKLPSSANANISAIPALFSPLYSSFLPVLSAPSL